MNGIFACFVTVGTPDWMILSVTGMFASCESPESSTVTTIDMFVRTTTVVCADVLSSVPAGSTLTETIFVPRRPPVVGVEVLPRMRLEHGRHRRRRDEVGALQEVRVRDQRAAAVVRAGDALAVELGGGRALEGSW